MFNLDIKNKEMFKYNEEILYLLISYIIGNSLNFGHHFIELAFNPIEKEYFIVKSNKYSNYNHTTSCVCLNIITILVTYDAYASHLLLITNN